MILIWIIIFIISFILLTYMFENWKFQSCSDDQYLKFKTFISFYNINPYRWSFDAQYENRVYFKSYSHNVSQTHKFNFIDYYRFKNWRKQKKKKEKKQQELQNMSKMIEVIKYDLSQFEEENQRQIEKATNNIKEIISRM